MIWVSLLPPPKIKIKTVTIAQLLLHSKSQDRKIESHERKKNERIKRRRKSQRERVERNR